MSNDADTHLVLNYIPSEWTGWEWGKTLGGHHSSREFKLAGRRYRIALLAFGRPGSSPSPVYEAIPRDPTIAFQRTLERKFGAHYAFRYRGGFRGRDEFRVRCYSVFAEAQQTSFGAQLYLVYEPDTRAGDPGAQAQLKWIQVVHWTGAGSTSPAPYVDNTACPNPFFISGGLVSVHGAPVVNFDNPITVQPSHGRSVRSARYVAETFLARDTLTKETGRNVIEIYGGVKYGWQLQEVR